MNFNKNYARIFTVFALILCFNNKAFSQQTIINIPSSELLPAGEIVLKQSNRFRPFNDDGFVSLTPSFTMGVGRGFEISSGVGTNISDSTVVRGDFAAKKVWFLGSSSRLTLGGLVSPYMNNGEKPDSMIYSHFSQRIKKTKTSLTAGAYLGGYNRMPNGLGVMLGVEQVIIPNKFRLALDWMSGSESNGRLGVGFKYRPHSTVSITSAVIIPNKESDDIAFNISVSKYISLDDENPIKRRLKNVD